MTLKTIYIAIPSLDDTELVPTVLNAFESAKYPERVFIGVSLFAKDKWRKKDFLKATKKFSNNISFEYTHLSPKTIDLLLVGHGRKRAMSFYNNEDYYLQVDSHTLFEKDWDEDLINIYHNAVDFVKNDKVVLTAYAGYYEYDENLKRVFVDPDRKIIQNGWLHCPYYMADSFYYGGIPRWDLIPPEEMIRFKPGSFLPVIKFNANFAFSDGKFVNSSGLYEKAEFFEEEPLQTLNLIKLGYTLVYPVLEKPIIGHLYGLNIKKNRGERLNKGSYLNGDPDGQISVNNYRSYLKDPDNQDVIKIYQEYTEMDLRFGPIKTKYLIPKKFLNSEVCIDV